MAERLNKVKKEKTEKLVYEAPALTVVELHPEEQLLACHKRGFPTCSVTRLS